MSSLGSINNSIQSPTIPVVASEKTIRKTVHNHQVQKEIIYNVYNVLVLHSMVSNSMLQPMESRLDKRDSFVFIITCTTVLIILSCLLMVNSLIILFFLTTTITTTDQWTIDL